MESERMLQLIENMEHDLRALKQLVGGQDMSALGVHKESSYYNPGMGSDAETIEGIFDGERMVDETGKNYQVSPNYASKSKLVEGDPLKLYITADGKFFYKQLGPVERKTLSGTLRSEGSHYVIEGEDENTYNVLTASVTYYMSLYGMKVGDRVAFLIPADRQATWAVIDNVL